MVYQPLPRLIYSSNVESWANQLVQELERLFHNLRQVSSTSFQGDKELFTGYFFEGKPIYRKCLAVPETFLLVNNTAVPHGIDSISSVIALHGHYAANGNYYQINRHGSFFLTSTHVVSEIVNIIPLVNFEQGCIIIEYLK